MSSKNYRELQVGDKVRINVGSQRCIGIVEEILKGYPVVNTDIDPKLHCTMWANSEYHNVEKVEVSNEQ